MRVVLLLACVLALESADQTAVGAAAPELTRALRISNAELGLLAAISTFVGALGTVPAGVLADRLRRVDLLAAALALWGVAMAFGAAAQGYEWLLLSRLDLGAVTAAAGPAIASLTGDFFAAAERGKIYGYILTGELIGAGFGFVVSGSTAGAVSWRAAFGVLILPAVALAYVIWRYLPEPARGGESRLQRGAGRIVDADRAASLEGDAAAAGDSGESREDGAARRAVAQRRIDPIKRNILGGDPAQMGLPQAIGYVLRVRTNLWLIGASAVGYFFFAGMRTFGLVFVRGHFSLSQPTATLVLFLAGLGSLAGVLLVGRLADRLIRRGRLDVRVLLGGISYLLAAAVLVPAVTVSALAVALPLLTAGAAALAAPNPPLDAARLDIMPAGLWGRAEGVRALLRQLAQAGAPLVFGLLADTLTGGGHALHAQSPGAVSGATVQGLQYAFLIMLVPLALNGIVLLGARRYYPADVATAIASEAATKAGRRSSVSGEEAAVRELERNLDYRESALSS